MYEVSSSVCWCNNQSHVVCAGNDRLNTNMSSTISVMNPIDCHKILRILLVRIVSVPVRLRIRLYIYIYIYIYSVLSCHSYNYDIFGCFHQIRGLPVFTGIILRHLVPKVETLQRMDGIEQDSVALIPLQRYQLDNRRHRRLRGRHIILCGCIAWQFD